MDEDENMSDVFDGLNEDDNSWVPPYMEQEGNSNRQQQNVQNNSQPQANMGSAGSDGGWSKKQTGAVIITITFMLIIILFTVRGCSIRKNPQNFSSSTQSVNSVKLQQDTTDGNGEENASNIDVSLAKTGVVDSSPSADNSNVNLTNDTSNGSEISESSSVNVDSQNASPDDAIVEGDNGSIEVGEPALSDIMTVLGMVSGKYIYKNKYGYLYEIRLIVAIGNGENVFSTYYCAKKSWDALQVGEGVSVQYQCDNAGNISIYSLAKGN